MTIPALNAQLQVAAVRKPREHHRSDGRITRCIEQSGDARRQSTVISRVRERAAALLALHEATSRMPSCAYMDHGRNCTIPPSARAVFRTLNSRLVIRRFGLNVLGTGGAPKEGGLYPVATVAQKV